MQSKGCSPDRVTESRLTPFDLWTCTFGMLQSHWLLLQIMKWQNALQNDIV
jgi:hypothetical protein